MPMWTKLVLFEVGLSIVWLNKVILLAKIIYLSSSKAQASKFAALL